MTMVHTARGTAVVAEKKQRAEESVSFTSRNSGRLGALSFGHMFAVEVVVGIAAGVFTVTADKTTNAALPWYIGGGVAALVILVVMFVRSGGMWLYQAVPMRRRLSRRNSRPTGMSKEVLHGVAPDLGIVQIEDRDTEIGIGSDEGGWFAAIEMGGIDGVTEAVPLNRLARLFTESGVPISAIQVVGHTVPIGLVGHDGSPAAASYQELLGGIPAVVHQTSWLAIRMDSEDALDAATDRGGDIEGVHKALAVTISRVGKLLRNAGVPNRVLDAEGLRGTLEASLGLTMTDVPSNQSRVGESWTEWQGDGLQHVTYRIAKWPTDEEVLPRVIDVLAAVPAVFTTASITMRPGIVDGRDVDGRPTGRRVEVECLIRLAGDAQTATAAQDRVLAAAKGLGSKLERLNGQQGPAAYASAPTGGGSQ